MNVNEVSLILKDESLELSEEQIDILEPVFSATINLLIANGLTDSQIANLHYKITLEFDQRVLKSILS